MSLPRRVSTPPSIAAQPRERAPVASVPWDLAELSTDGVHSAAAKPAAKPTATPAAPAGPFDRPLARAGHHISPSELTALREQMQEQFVRAVADAKRAAFEEGRSAGRAEAHAAAERRLADAIAATNSAARAVSDHESHYVGVLEENLTALATAIARHVIERDLQLDPSTIRSIVQQALTQFPQESNLRVRLHPADHALLAGDPSYPEVTWVSDARIVRGGCVVEGRERIIDGRVDLALEQIYRRLSGTDA